jgi:hypothetical protein
MPPHLPLTSPASLPPPRGKKNKEYEDEKEEQWKAQQDVLKARRTGDAIKDANVRRQQVAVSGRARGAACCSARVPPSRALGPCP